MLNKYKIKVIKKYDFELDGKSEKDIQTQVEYIMNKTNILDLPEIKKSTKIKIKRSYERNEHKNEKHN